MAKRALIIAGAVAIVLILVLGGVFYCVLDKEDGKDDRGNIQHPAEWDMEFLDEKNSTEDGVQDMVSANNRFAMDLYLRLLEDENVMICPYSIFSALSMTYEGANGNTASQMKDVLHLPDDDIERRGSFAKVQNDINRGSEEYELATANKIWPHEGFPVEEDFVNIIKQFYYGGVEALDYGNDPASCREKINTWVANRTNDRIEDLIPEGVLGYETYMVLTNAVYFKGTWVFQFDEDETIDRDFHREDGTKVQVPMMSMLLEDDDQLDYWEDSDLQAVELPYEGDEVSMMLLLPKDGTLSEMESELDAERLEEIRNGMDKTEIELYMPRFDMKQKYNLNEPLKDLGMTDAFGDADFSKMTPELDLFIDQVFHDTFIEVNEEGTEAAGATAVGVSYESIPSYPTFNANRPFMFLIQQKETGNILFMGRVADPSI
ncbi:MAG: serpin family protein [Thermoplasmatota archaeon]